MKPHCKQDENAGHHQRACDGAYDAKHPTVQKERAEHGAKCTDQHHALHGDIEDAGVVRERTADGCQENGCSPHEHGTVQSIEHVHWRLSLSFLRVAMRSKTRFRLTLPATTTSTMIAWSTSMNSEGTAVTSSMPIAPC